MKQSKVVLSSICLVLTFIGQVQAQELISVNPVEYQHALKNPLKGFRPDLQNADDPYVSIVRHYIKWNEIENSEDDDYTKLVDFSNQHWSHLPSENIKVIPRIYVDWDRNPGNEYWPADILEKTGLDPDDPELWRSQIVKDRLVKLIQKMGKAWDLDSRVAWIQTGLVGHWGEQENPIGVDEEGYTKLLGAAFDEAFTNKRLVVRNQNVWDQEDFEWGVYWDSYGHPGQRNGSWADIRYTNSRDRYYNQIIEGEVAYNWGESQFDPLYGGEPTITMGNDEYANNMIDVIRELHGTGLGWIADYDINGQHGTDPEIVKNNADRMQKAFGYRYIITQFSSSAATSVSRELDVNFAVKNTGSAPFYYNWPVAAVLIGTATKEIAWQKILTGIDITEWMPGDDYDYDTKVYQKEAKEYFYEKTVIIPDSIADGEYMIALTILEPYSQSPGIFFAIENFLADSQTQPLMKVGVGKNVEEGHDIEIEFDDPLNEDSRYYTTTSNVNMYQYFGEAKVVNTVDSVENLQGGSVSPRSGNFAENTTVTLTANPDPGFEFEGWEGSITGSENPKKLIIDSEKTVTGVFRYVGLPTYTDTIYQIEAPDSVVVGEEIKVKVEYEASEGRSIRVFIQLNADPWTTYGSISKNVEMGRRTDEFIFNVPSNIPESDDAYKIVVNLLPIGGSWSDRLDEKTKFNIDAVKRVVLVTSVEIANCSDSPVMEGSSLLLEAIISPQDATNQAVNWSSSDSNIATVDENGLVNALKEGDATIFVETEDGEYETSCNISVHAEEEPLNALINIEDFQLYPNPARDFVNIEFKEHNLRVICFYNTAGKMLLRFKTRQSKLKIDLSELNKENHLILKIKSGESTSTRKLILTGLDIY